MANARRTANQVAPAAIVETVARRTARPCEPGDTVPWFITAPVLCELITEPSDSHDIIAPADTAEPIENADPNDDTEPMESAEPTDPILSTEPTEPMDSSEPSEASDHFDVDMGLTIRAGHSRGALSASAAAVAHQPAWPRRRPGTAPRRHQWASERPWSAGTTVLLVASLGGTCPAATARRSFGLNPRIRRCSAATRFPGGTSIRNP